MLIACVCVASAIACGGDTDAPSTNSYGFEPLSGVDKQANQDSLSGEEKLVIRLAEQRLIQACMTEQGYDYDSVFDFVTSTALTPAPSYLSPTELRRSGYQFDWDNSRRQREAMLNEQGTLVDPIQHLSAAEAASFELALYGSPDETVEVYTQSDERTELPSTGCEAEARIELYGSLANYARYDNAVEMFSTRIAAELSEQETYIEPLADWQNCMRDQALGFDLSGPIDYGFVYLRSWQLVALTSDTLYPSDATIQAVARADADCQEISGLYQVRESLLPDVTDKVAQDLGFEQSQYIAFSQTLLHKAQTIP